ncbi:MAG: metallophosphatase [Bacteroidales bacterium]|nr:metallophosphatase [Bacteroidales bacterium]
MKFIKNKFSSLVAVVLLSSTLFLVQCQQKTIIEGVGDLYVLYDENEGYRILAAGSDGELLDTLLYTSLKSLWFRYIAADEQTEVTFDFRLHDKKKHRKEERFSVPWIPEKLLVVSDLHGRLDAFVALLKGNGVIDDRLHWRYGKNQLIFIGDILDRGRDDNGIAWLLYKLQEEAWQAGGKVVFIPGNHEDLVLKNDLRYVNKEHLEFAEKTGVSYSDLYGPNTVLGHWIRSSDLIWVVGEDLFVHAGLSTVMVENDYSIEEINQLGKQFIGYSTKEKKELHPRNELLFGRYGPLWYRGLVFDTERYPPISSEDLDIVLQYYKVKRIIVGHSEVKEIEQRYDGRVFAVNVKHYRNYPTDSTAALLIKRDSTFAVTYTGKKTLPRLYPPSG